MEGLVAAEQLRLGMTSGLPEVLPWENEDLTPEEQNDAMNSAKKEKYLRKQQSTIKQVMQAKWTPEQMYDYLLQVRAIKLGFSENGGADGKPVFQVDDNNKDIIYALCLYFTNDQGFEKLCTKDETGSLIQMNWRLNKGLMIVGGVGIGKTTLMRLFAVNKRQPFDVVNCIDIANQYMVPDEKTGGINAVNKYRGIHRKINPGSENLYHDAVGVTFDDLGTEKKKNHFGNECNVMADILQLRYANNNLKKEFTHVVTNQTAKDLLGTYGIRTHDRMREMFNIMIVPGTSRRL